MSVLINMEMPNKKNGAVLIIYPGGKCAFEDGKTYQAVSVPPHGRLIDADKLKADNPRHMDADVPYVTEVTVEEIIDAAPTIIPASEEGET